uniref:PH domain-containing protein n=1 Tax=Branchiostoma floridae TaxID=7739 RepID=C3ZU12_BRAFL|eukprot:XP_002587887.1 hypothetical protein BRAFLDRAFT_87274 [Branchiostoma floridae]
MPTLFSTVLSKLVHTTQLTPCSYTSQVHVHVNFSRVCSLSTSSGSVKHVPVLTSLPLATPCSTASQVQGQSLRRRKMGKKKQTKVTKKGGLIYSKAEWKEEYPAFRSGGGDENLVPRRPKKGDRERRARPYSEPVLSEINVDEPYDEEKARTLDRPSRPKSVMVGGPEARTKSPSRQPSRNLLSCLQIPEEQDEDEAVVTGDVPRIVVEEVDQPPTKRARQEPTKRSPQDPRHGRHGDVPMETGLPIEAIHLAGPAKPGRDAKGSPAKPTGTGTEASLDRRGPGTKGKPGDEGRSGTPDTDEKGKGKKKKVFGGKKKEKEDAEKDAQEGKKKPKEKKKEKERKNKKAAEKGNEREDRRQSPEGDDGTLQLREASLDRDPHGRGRLKDKRSSRQSPEHRPEDDLALAPTRVDDLAFTPVPVEHVTLAPAANMAAAPPQSKARVQAAPAYASRPEMVCPSEAPSDAPRMIKITFPVEQGVQTSPKSTPTSPTYLSPTSARPGSPESSPDNRRDGERGRARQRRTPEGGALEGEFLRRRSPLGDRYIVEKARLLDANVTPTDYAKMEAELESRSAPPGLEYPEHRSGAVPEYLVIGGLEHRSIPTQTTSSVFSRPSYSYTDSTATIAMATHADTMATHPDSHALRKVVAKEVSVSSLQDVSSSPGGEAVSGEMVTTETQEYKLYSSSSSFKTIEMYGAKFTLVGPTPTVVTETTTTSHITGTEPEYVTATSYVSGSPTQPGTNQMQYTTSTSHMPPETNYVTSYVSGAPTQPDAGQTQYTTSTGFVTGAHSDASPVQYTTSVTTYSAGPAQYAVPAQPASTGPTQYAVQAQQVNAGLTPAQPAVVVRREAATIQTVQHNKAANREAAVVESSHDIEIRPLRMEEETREEASPRSPEVIVSNLSPVRETVATFEQPTPDDAATSQYKLNYMHFPGRDTTITVVKRLSAGPTTLEGQQPEGEGGADLQADHSQGKPEVTYETKTVVTEVKSEVRQQKVPEVSYKPEEVKVKTNDLQESAPTFETKYEERAVDVPLPKAPPEEEVAAEVPEKKEKKKKKKRSWFRKGSSSSTSDDHSDAAEKPVTTVTAGDGVDAAVAMATVDDRVDADVAMATVSKPVEEKVVTMTTTRVVSGVEAGPERGMLGVEASVEPREIPEATLHAGKAEPGQGGAGDDLEGVGKVVMAEVKHEPMVLKDKPTGEGEEMRTVGREITGKGELDGHTGTDGQTLHTSEPGTSYSGDGQMLGMIGDSLQSNSGVTQVSSPGVTSPGVTQVSSSGVSQESGEVDNLELLTLAAEQAAEEHNDDDDNNGGSVANRESDPTVQAVLNDIAHTITQLLEGDGRGLDDNSSTLDTQLNALLDTQESSQGDKRTVPSQEEELRLPRCHDDKTASFLADVSEALQVLKGSEADMTPVSQAVSQPITAPSYGSPVSQTSSQPIRAPAYRSPVNQDPSQPIRVSSYSSPVNQPVSEPISASSSRSPVSQDASQPIRAAVNQPVSQPIRAPSYSSPVNQDPSQPIRAPSQSPESENRPRGASARPDQSDRPGELTILLEGQKAAVPLSRQDRPYERLKNIIKAIDKVLESEGEAKASSALPLHEGIPRSAPHEGTSRSISVQTVQHSSLSNKEVQTDEEVDSEDDFLEVWAGRSPHSPSDRVIISRVPARQSTERRRAAGPTPDNRRPTLDDITVYRDGGCQTEFEADPQLGSPRGVGTEPLGEGSPYEKWRWEEINVVIKHQQDGGKTDVEGVETTWKRVPDVGDGEGEETTGVFDDSYRANNWIYVGDDDELPSAQSTPKGSPVMHSMGTSTDDDDDLPVEFSRRQVGHESTDKMASYRKQYCNHTCMSPVCYLYVTDLPVEFSRRQVGRESTDLPVEFSRRQVGRESTGTTLSEASFRQRYRNASRRKRQDTSARLANLPPAVRERTIRLAKQPGVQFGFRIQKSRPIVITEVDRGPTDRLTLTVATTLGNTLRDMGGEPVATGYLHKLSGGRVGKQWRKRWFVLKKDNTLYYYKTREDKEPLGTIVLANYTITPAHEIGRTHAFKASRFNTRTYYFSAGTEEEMDMWSRLLNQASAQSAKVFQSAKVYLYVLKTC